MKPLTTVVLLAVLVGACYSKQPYYDRYYDGYYDRYYAKYYNSDDGYDDYYYKYKYQTYRPRYYDRYYDSESKYSFNRDTNSNYYYYSRNPYYYSYYNRNGYYDDQYSYYYYNNDDYSYYGKDYSKVRYYSSCKEIREYYPNTPSGYYWIVANDERVRRVYCDMTTQLCGLYGWERLYFLDFRYNDTYDCPGGFEKSKYYDRMQFNYYCKSNYNQRYKYTSATFDLEDSKYYEMCAKIGGYQKGMPTAFQPYYSNYDPTVFVDGVVFSYGQYQKHIWTYAVGSYRYYNANENSSLQQFCPDSSYKYQYHTPYFIGYDYYCDSGLYRYTSTNDYSDVHEYRLWEGEDCKPGNCGCYRGDQPWFYKKTAQPFYDYIEMRSYISGDRRSTDVYLDNIAVFVR